jgi:putative transposase
MYRTHNVAESCEITGIPVRTGYDLLKKWNEFGIEGLRHKQGAGRPSRLSKEQFEELDKWMFEQEYLVTKEVYLHIKDTYGIDYSLRQVRRIIVKLGYSWISPYPIADQQAENAEEIMKEKTKIIDPEKDIYGFLDETAVQNSPNVKKIIKKKDPNLK